MPSSSPFDRTSTRRKSTRHSRNASVSSTKHLYGFVAISCLALLGSVHAQVIGDVNPLIQEYCSTSNTADNKEPYHSTYMSLGLCKSHCISNYAFAVVQGKDCWCSNIVPDSQLSVDKHCDNSCPGYPDNKCGGNDTFGYLALPAHSPSGTAGVTSSPESTGDNTPTPVVSVVTLAGSTQTITIAPSAGTSAGMAGQVVATPKDDFFSNAGRVAGVFIVIAIAIMALIGVIIWMFMKRRRNRSRYGGAETPDSLRSSNGDSRGGVEGAAANPKRKSRSMSTLGLVGAFNSEKNLPTIATTPATGGGPSSTIPSQQTPERLTDQRLDPHQVWMRFENDNASRVSVRSLRDDQDYSRRVLRLTNPDGI